MPHYKYKSIDSSGKTTNGTLNARSKEALSVMLQERGLFLMEARIAAAPDAAEPQKPAVPETAAEERPAGTGAKVALKEVAVFTSQLMIMLRTALPILESLDMLARQSQNPVMQSILLDVSRSLRAGQPLSRAFGRYPATFDEVYISLLAAGEASGRLDVMLDRLSSYLDFQVQLKEKVSSALVYPTIVALTAGAVVAFMIVFVLPTFMEVFSQFNIELPLPTRVLIFVSAQIREWWYALLAGAAGVWWYFSRWLTDPAHTWQIHSLQLRLPIAGKLTRNIVMTRILRTLGSLTESGIPILKSLEIAKAAGGNLVFGDLMENIMDDVREGRGLSAGLSKSPYIPPTVVGMIATGEKTGSLPEVINKVASFYEAETDTAIKELFSAIEPLFVVGLSILVGGIAVSVLLPMFNLAGGIQ
jgi:type IV pilus assembly protein PilC